jgi:hypothetical protein
MYIAPFRWGASHTQIRIEILASKILGRTRQANSIVRALEFQGGAATKPEAEYGNDGGKNRDHARDGTAVVQKSPTFLRLSEF